MALFKIPKIPKIPIPSPAKAITQTNLELQKAALKAQKAASYIKVPEVGTKIKSISKAFSIKNSELETLSLTNSELQTLLTNTQTTISNQISNIQNSSSISVIDENGNITNTTIENINENVQNTTEQITEGLSNLENIQNDTQEQLNQLQELSENIQNFDISVVNSRRLTIPIPKMPKLPFGIIQPF